MKNITEIINEARHKEWHYIFNFYKGPWSDSDPSKNLVDTIEYTGNKLNTHWDHISAYEKAWLTKHGKSEGMPGRGIGVTCTFVNDEWVK